MLHKKEKQEKIKIREKTQIGFATERQVKNKEVEIIDRKSDICV